MLMSARRNVLAQRLSTPEVVATPEPLLRTLLGDALRRERQRQRRTLRDVSGAARVSLGYLSEIERGQKEASSELLAAICASLQLRVLDVLSTVLVADGAPVHRLETVSSALLEAAAPLQIRPAGAPDLVNRAA